MPGYNHLFIPGPTNMPERIRRACDRGLQDMRAPDFPDFVRPLLADLKQIFKTETGQVFVFNGSGTGGWEAAIANTLSPGDKVLTSVFGQFSMLWVDMCERFGLDVHSIDCTWGEGAPVEQYAEILKADTNHENNDLEHDNSPWWGALDDVELAHSAALSFGFNMLAEHVTKHLRTRDCAKGNFRMRSITGLKDDVPEREQAQEQGPINADVLYTVEL